MAEPPPLCTGKVSNRAAAGMRSIVLPRAIWKDAPMPAPSRSLTDFLVIGGGIVGVNIARALRARFPGAAIVVLEKEAACGLHASGRNSGVIHAGFYYSADSLKARFAREGNRSLLEYCDAHAIPVNRCGKLVVARSAEDLPMLDELARRGAKNGVEVQPITAEEARLIEPRVKTFQRALFSPNTATADPGLVMRSVAAEAGSEGIRILHGAGYLRRGDGGGRVVTAAGEFEADYVVNAAGLYADRIARDFGFSERYRILPFKGIYLYSDEPAGAFRTNIYPVPDLRNPFLGVHFTVTVDGRAKIGPTAIPAFWREQYRAFDNFRLGEFVEVLFREAGLMLSSDFDFRQLALEEMKKYSKPHLVALASELAVGVSASDYRRWGVPGIRAQLLDIRTKRLEMDFILEGDGRSMHVLNAVSPGWTCAIPFARYVGEKVAAAVG